MLLKATEQSDTGLNTKFVNVESGRTVTLKHAIKQIENVLPQNFPVRLHLSVSILP